MRLNMATKFLHLPRPSKIAWLCLNPKGMMPFLFHNIWQKLSAFLNYVVQLFMKIQSTIYTFYTYMSGAYNKNSICAEIPNVYKRESLMTHITQLWRYCLPLSCNKLNCYKSKNWTEYATACSIISDTLEAVSKISYQYVNSYYKDQMSYRLIFLMVIPIHWKVICVLRRGPGNGWDWSITGYALLARTGYDHRMQQLVWLSCTNTVNTVRILWLRPHYITTFHEEIPW